MDDLLESWYKNVGYLPGLDELISEVLEHVLSPDVISNVKMTLRKTKNDRTMGLWDSRTETGRGESAGTAEKETKKALRRYLNMKLAELSQSR